MPTSTKRRRPAKADAHHCPDGDGVATAPPILPPAGPDAAVTATLEPTASWLDGYPAEWRDVLREHGMHPDDHPAARTYNDAIIERARSGLSGDALRDAAIALHREYFGEDEPEDDEDLAEIYVDLSDPEK